MFAMKVHRGCVEAENLDFKLAVSWESNVVETSV